MKLKGLWKSTLLAMMAFAFVYLMGNVAQAAAPVQIPNVESTKGATAPSSSPSTITQTAAGETSITLQWGVVTGATGYRIYYAKTDVTADKYVEVDGKTTYKFTGLSKNSLYNFYIYAYAKDSVGTEFSTSYSSYTKIPTLPTKITGVKFANYDLSTRKQYFTYNLRESADAIQYQIFNAKGTRIASAIVSSGTYNASKDYITFTSSKIKTNQYYKVRLRGVVYVKGNTKKYGKWSDQVWFGQGSKLTSWSNTSSGAKVIWEKMTGAKNYTVYVSNKQKSGYKKVGTTTKTNISFSKYNKKTLKDGQKYWVRVVANKKVGSKTIKSLSIYSWSFTYSK